MGQGEELRFALTAAFDTGLRGAFVVSPVLSLPPVGATSERRDD
jgi:hypothetical protein